MIIEDQACSFELAKRLKELGVKQESHFYWSAPIDDYPSISCLGDDLTKYHTKDECYFSAFTVAEMGKMIPNDLTLTSIRTKSYDGMIILECYIPSVEKIPDYKKTEGQTEADARAKMLIHLIEQGVIKP